MATTKSTRAAKAQSRKRSPVRSGASKPSRVSRAAIRTEMMAIADRAFSSAFNEMIRYVVRVNPHSRGFPQQFLRAMRAQLEDREASEGVQS